MPFTDPLIISYLVPELQSFEDPKMKAKSTDMRYGNQSKLTKFVTARTFLKDLVINRAFQK